MATRGWSANPDDLLEIRLLEWVYDISQGTSTPALGTFAEDHDAEVDRARVKELALKLAADGLIQGPTPGRTAGPLATGFRTTPRGADVVRSRRARAEDPKERAIACREAFLDWLYAEKLRGAKASLADSFATDTRSWIEGVRFSEQEIQAAGQHLRDRGLISAMGGAGKAVIRADIEALGEQVVEEFDGQLATWSNAERRGGSQFVTHFHAPVPGQVGIGESVTQSQTTGIDADHLQRLLEDVREAIESVPESDRQYVLTYVDLIQAEATADAPNVELLRGSSDRLKKIATKVGDASFQASLGALLHYVATAVIGG